MKFVDEVTIRVQAGKGGDGCLSFFRGRNNPRGGPDGGDGGNGGSVFLVGHTSLNTLVDLRFQPLIQAEYGRAGGSANRTGANGTDVNVAVPIGTTVIDDETLEVVGDITDTEDVLCVARGGHFGRGNAFFKSSTNRAPRRTTSGEAGDTRILRLQLKVVADVGLLGLPNAGKSTLISRISASRPKIADYPFTTLIPNLGVVRVAEDANFVVADIPGLVPGASGGAGLGMRFLRHLVRTRLLLHMVDIEPLDGSDPVANAKAIESELSQFSPLFSDIPIWTLATKMDVVAEEQGQEVVKRLAEAFPGRPCYAISAVTGVGIDFLVNKLMQHVTDWRESLASDPALDERDRGLEARLTKDVLNQALRSSATGDRRAVRDPKVEVLYRE
ncbi:MAG: Obg family GTPase CgtA [Pseudomonadales bacterium]|nr:Obg family GTPase CgtA [Pseudomonadales bacterium]